MAKKKPYRFLLYAVARGGAAVLAVLPRSILIALAKGMGRVAFFLVGRQRRRTVEHLKQAFQTERSEMEIRQIGIRVFENLSQTAAELLLFKKFRRQGFENLIVAGKAFEVYDELLKEGRGLISMTAHLGNWELLAGLFGAKGYKGAVLARRIYYEPYNRWVVGLRECLNVQTIYRDQSSREILSRLKRNEIIGLLPDQDIDSLKGLFVPYFGRPAYTPIAPARLALASGAPLVTNFMIRKPDGRYEWVLGDVLRVPDQVSKEEAIEKLTYQWMQSFEAMIRKYPEQWAWMHNRWKTQQDRVKSATRDKALGSVKG